MILVEKKVLKEKKNCLNMDTQQKKNFNLLKKKNNGLMAKKISKLHLEENFSKVKKIKTVSEKIPFNKIANDKKKYQNYSKNYPQNYDPEFVKSKWFKKSYKFFKHFRYRPVSWKDKKKSFLFKCSLVGFSQLRYFKFLYFNFRYKRYKRFYIFRKKYRYALLKIRRRLKKKKYVSVIFDYYKKYNLVFYKKKVISDRKNRIFRTTKKFVLKKINRFDKLKMLNYLLNNLVTRGKKKKSYHIILNLLILFKYKFRKNILKYLENSINNVKPLVNFKTLYIGGKKYKIPVLLNYSRSNKYALKWIINTAKENKKNNFALALLNEFVDSSRNESLTVKKRKEHHLLAYENKSYIRFLRFFKS